MTPSPFSGEPKATVDDIPRDREGLEGVKMTAHIASIVSKTKDLERRPPDWYARKPLDRAMLVAAHGIEGDAMSQRGKRQLNVMFAEVIAELKSEGFSCEPGELGEQIVIAGLGGTPAVGTRLRIGDTAVIECTELREGCGRFEHIQGKSKDSAAGRLGFMARVIVGGEIAVGMAVTVAE